MTLIRWHYPDGIVSGKRLMRLYP